MTQTANDRQVGGDHYGKVEYQHWDFVTDVAMSYITGCATKYVARWRNKNGLQDLQKARHYLEKSIERRQEVKTLLLPSERDLLDKFCDQLGAAEAAIIRLIAEDEYEAALAILDELIKDVTAAEQAASATGSPTPASPA